MVCREGDNKLYSSLPTNSTEGTRITDHKNQKNPTQTSQPRVMSKLEHAYGLATMIQEQSVRLRSRINVLTVEIENWKMISEFWKNEYEEKKVNLDHLLCSVSDEVQKTSEVILRSLKTIDSPDVDLPTKTLSSSDDSIGTLMKKSIFG
jgi:hypothetical protein